MVNKSGNKSALVRDYLAKYPEKGPAAIAQQINQERGLKLSGSFVASVKTKLKQASGSAAVASKPAPTAVTPTKKETRASQRESHSSPARKGTGDCSGPIAAHRQLEGCGATAGQGRSQANHRPVLIHDKLVVSR